MASFPTVVSLTLTNVCNLRCRMCGQWGTSGYLHRRGKPNSLPGERWIELVDEAARNGVKVVGIRGGEPFLFPSIIRVLKAIKERGLFGYIDTNGTLLERFAPEILESGIDAINLSVDGPEPVHDLVRGVPGTFQALTRGTLRLRDLERRQGRRRTVGVICFTISPDSLAGLPDMPEVARRLDVPALAVNPYYYFSAAEGCLYETMMRDQLDCEAYYWRGFERPASGIEFDHFIRTYRDFRSRLKEIELVPFMDFSEEDYRQWFSGNLAPAGPRRECQNPWRLLDIQPGGDANFCVDYPDYVIGNVASSSIAEVWNGARAERFRAFIGKNTPPVCFRCGAKYMS